MQQHNSHNPARQGLPQQVLPLARKSQNSAGIKQLKHPQKLAASSPLHASALPPRKNIAKPVAVGSPAQRGPLHFDLSDWQQMPFFKQIQTDRLEQDIVMGRKYNLNLASHHSPFELN